MPFESLPVERSFSLLLTSLALFLVWGPIHSVLADSNGMDMSMDGPMVLAEGQMLPYLHFTTGDNLFFLGWVPKSAGAMIGVCVALLLLAVIDRWLAACRSLMEAQWRKRALAMLEAKQAARPSHCKLEHGKANGDDDTSMIIPVLPRSPTASILGNRRIPPFVLSQDVVRGVVHTGQAALTFAFMLAVMTFQAGFILSIVIGLGIGEMLFGRYHVHAHL